MGSLNTDLEWGSVARTNLESEGRHVRFLHAGFLQVTPAIGSVSRAGRGLSMMAWPIASLVLVEGTVDRVHSTGAIPKNLRSPQSCTLSPMKSRLARLARSLLPGILLIAAACAVLILTDRTRARGDRTDGVHTTRIAVLLFTNIAAFEQGYEGLVKQLASVGYSRESGTTIDLFNPAGDTATLAQMCTQIGSANPPYDLVVSLGTATTQAFARANSRAVPHVMGFVASPPAINIPLGAYAEGGGRPASLAGFGCMQPIGALFEALRATAPSAKRIGVVYNPAEPNAEAAMKVARAAAGPLGFELVEANGSNVTEVVNAADAVLARDIDVFWLLPDTVVSSAAKTLIRRARERHAGVIASLPELGSEGAHLCIGADWDACGTVTGLYAELLLHGVDPRTLPVENFVPQRVTVSDEALPSGWAFPSELRARARQARGDTLGPKSLQEALEALRAKPRPRPRAGIPSIALLTYNRTPNFEDCYAGFEEEWAKLGYADGRNCSMRLRDAQFDSGTLNTLAAAIAAEKPDLVITFTTPALQTALRRIPDRTIVFSLCSSGVAAGAGQSETNHLPNITGAEVGADWDAMIEVARAALPKLRRAGTVYSPGEANSVYFHDLWKAKLAAAGIELVSVGADKPTELPEAADSLATLGIDAILQISDNSSSTGFRTIVRAADRANIPVFGFSPTSVRFGAALSVSRDYRDVGRVTAVLADRVLRGESPAAIPFTAPTETVFVVNPDRLRRFGLTLPKPLLDRARIESESADAAPSAPK